MGVSRGSLVWFDLICLLCRQGGRKILNLYSRVGNGRWGLQRLRWTGSTLSSIPMIFPPEGFEFSGFYTKIINMLSACTDNIVEQYHNL